MVAARSRQVQNVPATVSSRHHVRTPPRLRLGTLEDLQHGGGRGARHERFRARVGDLHSAARQVQAGGAAFDRDRLSRLRIELDGARLRRGATPSRVASALHVEPAFLRGARHSPSELGGESSAAKKNATKLYYSIIFLRAMFF